MVHCPNCKRFFDDNFKFCPYCGKESLKPKICKECGFKSYEFNFCPNCGNKLTSLKEKEEETHKTTFKYLNELIQEGNNEITIDSDIILTNSEAEIFSEGIPIDVDNIIINGDGHTIDAHNQSRIFKNNAKNIIIKNIILKNGFNDYSAGAIINNG